MSDFNQIFWMTPPQVAKKLGRNIKTVYRWIKRGHLKSKRVGDGWYQVRSDWYAEFVEAGK